MAKPRLETSTVELAFVGRFVPMDLLPEKLLEVGAISDTEAKAVRFTSLLQGQIVDYQIEDWCAIQALEQRLIMRTSKVPYVRIADLALKGLREIMKAPVVTMFGINRDFHCIYPDSQSRDALGVRLAPPSAWGQWGKSIEDDMKLPLEQGKHGGVMNITMRQQKPDDREFGYTDVYVTAVGPEPTSVTLKVNDHYQSDAKWDEEHLDQKVRDDARTSRLLETFSRSFDDSIRRAEVIVQGIVSA